MVCKSILVFVFVANSGDLQWCFSQVKGTVEEDVTEGYFPMLVDLDLRTTQRLHCVGVLKL